jgi:HAD superfamily hydrolase (TIGR01450 family)
LPQSPEGEVSRVVGRRAGGNETFRVHEIPEIPIEQLIERYDALLFDAYGVLVSVAGAMPGAPELIEMLNATGKPYCVVTNDASKLPETAAARYRRFGVELEPARIVTSGGLIDGYFREHDLSGARCAVLGTVDSVRYVEQAGGETVPPGHDFDVLVVGDETGYPFLEHVDDALTTLFRRIDAGARVHLVLPNPDLIYPRDEASFGIAAGSIALMFEAALQRRYPDRAPLAFARLGKPARYLYEEALRRCGTRRAVMIGDQLETDIRGANACGIDSALVTTGVSAADLLSVPAVLRPTWQMRSIAPVGIALRARGVVRGPTGPIDK